MNLRKKLFTMAALAGVVMGLAANNAFAAGPLHPVIPGGLTTQNINVAVSQIKTRANLDPAFAATLARNAGAAQYVAGQYVPAGYHKGAPGTVNTGSDTSGNIDNSQDTKECNSKTSTMAVMINIITHIKVYVCTACANPRVYSSRPAPRRVWAPFSKGTYVKYSMRKTQKVSIVCKTTGQKVTATVSVWVHGVLHAKVYGKVSGTLNAKLSAAFRGKVNVTTKLKCGAAPKSSPPATGTCTATNSPGATVCSTITYVTVCGTTVAYTGDQANIQTWVSQYIADHCQPTVTTTVCSQSGAINYGSPGPCAFPAPKCTDHNATNYGGSLPCTYPAPTCTDHSATNYGGSLPCQYPPPPACQPQVSVTSLNDLDAGGNSPNFRVTATMCGNDTGTLNVSAEFGSVAGGSSVAVSGQNTYTFTYYAPGEVPPGGQDWVTATVRDNTTGSSASASTPKFGINSPPPTT